MICTGFLIGAQRVVGSLQGFMGLYKVVKVSLVSIGCLKRAPSQVSLGSCKAFTGCDRSAFMFRRGFGGVASGIKVSENRGPKYTALNSRILIIRTPK